jgi:hypothetical protein
MNDHSPNFLSASRAPLPDAAVLVSVLVVIAFDVVMIKYCLDDLSRRLYVTGGDKRFWAAAIILGGPLGQFAYWLYGRGEY